MGEYWEDNFSENQEMWGFEPAKSAILTMRYFLEKKVQHVLIPGIGYGRNAQIFRDNGMSVTGIELSKTAIELAHKHCGSDLIIHHGSVTNMPFDDQEYDGIFCYALIHLLDSSEREKLLVDCYNQLADNGLMVFAVVSKKAPIYGRGKNISPDRFELVDGVNMFFYDRDTINSAFEKVGLFEITEVDDIYPFYLIKCRKTK